METICNVDYFNKSALQKIAGECLQKQCTSITMHDSVGPHDIYLLGMNDGSECAAQITKKYCSVLKSTATTMQYLTEHTTIPIPKIYAWDSDQANVVGAGYILFEKTSGTFLRDIWSDMLIEQKEEIVCQVANIMVQLFNLTFPKIGSLDTVAEGDYTVGPLIHYSFIRPPRGTLNIDRGPWVFSQDYFIAAARREISMLECTPYSSFDPFEIEVHKIYTQLLRLVPAFIPKDPTLDRCAFRNFGLGPYNFVVDGTRITSVIFWDCAGAYPAWSCARYPLLLDERVGDSTEWKTNARLCATFRTEVAKLDPSFLKTLDEGTRYREFEDAVTSTYENYENIDQWLKELRENWNSEEPFPLAEPPLVRKRAHED